LKKKLLSYLISDSFPYCPPLLRGKQFSENPHTQLKAFLAGNSCAYFLPWKIPLGRIALKNIPPIKKHPDISKPAENFFWTNKKDFAQEFWQNPTV